MKHNLSRYLPEIWRPWRAVVLNANNNNDDDDDDDDGDGDGDGDDDENLFSIPEIHQSGYRTCQWLQ